MRPAAPNVVSKIITHLAIAFIIGAGVATAQVDPAEVEVKTIRVEEGIYMLQGAGGNIGVSTGPDGVVLIDDDYKPLTVKILTALAKISDQHVRFVLNTHWHDDHTGGNENLGKSGALIVAHDNVRQRMSTEQFIAAFNLKVPASPAEALPVVTFTDAVTFHVNGEEIHAWHVPPAHTDGDSLVYFKNADVLHTGDLFFNGMYPFIDVSAGGSIDGMIAAVEQALERTTESTKIIPGHGPLAGRADLVAYLETLKAVRSTVAPMVEKGMSREDVVGAKPTADLDEKWGQGFMKPDIWVGIVYDGFKE